MLWDVEIMTPKGWQIVAESISYDEAIRRFGEDTEKRLTTARVQH